MPARGRYVRPRQPQSAQAAALFLLGLAGTLPIIASVKQAGHYLVPAVPLYALAAATFFAPTMAALSERLAAAARDRFVNSMSAVVLLAAIGVSFVPALGRDQPRLTDLDVLAASVPRGMTIGICPESNGDWGLHAWFERRFGVSLDAAHGAAARMVPGDRSTRGGVSSGGLHAGHRPAPGAGLDECSPDAPGRR